MDDRHIADGLVAIRTERNVSVEELAEALGINVAAYTRYEETLGFTREEFTILAEKLQVKVGVLYHNPDISSDFIDLSKFDDVDVYEEKQPKTTITVSSPYFEMLDEANKGKDPSEHVLFLNSIDYKKYLDGEPL